MATAASCVFCAKKLPHARLPACDLNLDNVEFWARTFGAVPVPSSVQIDAIPLPADFDLIWCGSLLTHLPAEACRAFLRRFHRALQPDGLCLPCTGANTKPSSRVATTAAGSTPPKSRAFSQTTSGTISARSITMTNPATASASPVLVS